ncbi:MAG: DUF4421 family protein [Bdellovibrionota bacterium]|nr:DUF4421 family protein [Bdellovibrionota bacterium]
MILAFLAIATLIHFNQEKLEFVEGQSLFFEAPNISYELAIDSDTDGLEEDKDKLSYEPVISGFQGMAVKTKWLTFSLAVQQKDDKLKDFEESRLFDFQVFGLYKNFHWELYYQNYQGLYITQDDIVADDNLPKANSYSYGASIHHFSNDDFNLSESFSSVQKKKKSAGSWLYGLSLNRSQLRADGGLIPEEFAASFDQLYGLKEFNTASMAVHGGYGGLYTFYDFFITGLISIGYQAQDQRFSGLEQDNRVVTGFSNFVHFEYGYQWDNKVLGLFARVNNSTIPVKNAEFELTRTHVRIYYKYFY